MLTVGIGGGQMIKKILPFLLFLICLGFLARGLQLNPREMPSAQIGKKISSQTFQVYQQNGLKSFRDWSGKPLIVHFYASWCNSCQQDTLQLQNLQTNTKALMIGVFYKDQLMHLQDWLALYPKLFHHIILDPKGRLGLELGVVATPETFIVDANGVIRYRYQGPLSFEVIQKQILPLLRQFNE
jgi:cytochrome c biogenesis protein CcmG, thiol:disulfide interchange protein DsbE